MILRNAGASLVGQVSACLPLGSVKAAKIKTRQAEQVAEKVDSPVILNAAKNLIGIKTTN